MTDDPRIRQSTPDDWPALRALYPAAFPEEDLLPLLASLLPHPALALSLVVEGEGGLEGHIAFTRCEVEVEGAGTGAPVALLAPLAVAPAAQRRGLGTALIEAGFARLPAMGLPLVLVLGDPGYYGRFGFATERQITPPYPLPPAWDGAWQSRALAPPDERGPGRLRVPGPWRDRALWSG